MMAKSRTSRLVSVGLVSAVLALAAALTPSLASATEVTPGGTTFTASLKSGTTSNFYPANAYSGVWVECHTATATFTTPQAGLEPEAGKFNDNINRTEVGTQSKGAGSVSMALAEETFSKCETNEEVPANVPTSGHWGLAAFGLSEQSGLMAISVPENGAEIEVGPGVCTIAVSPGQTSDVTAQYDNATSTLRVDGQIGMEGCELPPPAQFEAEYVVPEVEGHQLQIVP